MNARRYMSFGIASAAVALAVTSYRSGWWTWFPISIAWAIVSFIDYGIETARKIWSEPAA